MTNLNSLWNSRPEDQRFTSLASLHDAVAERTNRSHARVMPSTQMLADVQSTSDGLLFNTPVGLMQPSHWSFGQLCTTAKAPARYLRTLPRELAAINIQWGLDRVARDEQEVLYELPSSDTETSPSPVPTMRAVTSSSYGRIWDLDAVKAVGEVVEGTSWQLPFDVEGRQANNASTTLYASDRDCFIFMVDAERPIDVDGDVFFRGFMVWNSEVGSMSFGMAMFLYRSICRNRTIFGMQGQQELRIRHTSGGPERFMREARPMLEEYVNTSPAETVAMIRNAKKLEVGKDEKEVSAWLQARGFTAALAQNAINHAREEEGQARSLLDIVNGITASARSIGRTDARVDLERRAGRLLSRAA